MAEIEEWETMTGDAIDEFSDDGKPKAKQYRAIFFIIQRRSNPNYTYEETKNVTLGAIHEALFGSVNAPDPKG